MDTQAWKTLSVTTGALWMHDGNPKRPHVRLRSGKHSNGFFNGGILCSYGSWLSIAARQLVDQLRGDAYYTSAGGEANRVVGPAMGAVALASAISSSLWKIYTAFGITSYDCKWSYTVKVTDRDSGKTLRMEFDRSAIAPQPGDRVLLVEDTVTTGGSIELTAKAVEERGATVLPYVLALMNRSGKTEVNGRTICALMTENMQTWDSVEVCPLCAQGSVAIEAKGSEAWARLTASYE